LLLESEAEKPDGRLTMTDIRRFIFDRLNTGGTKLNPQEIRNALNTGRFTKVIIELTRFNLFTEVFDIPPYIEADPSEYYENPQRQKNNLYSTMGDCQIVLRYFALKDDNNIRGSMKSMLDRTMEQDVTEEQSDALIQEFQERFTFLYELFEGMPFVLPPDEKGRVRVSAALYDASMVAINSLWPFSEEVMNDAPSVRQRMTAALATPEGITILTGQGNTANAVRERINLMRKIFRPE
jgi:hypothetical protein